MRESFMIEANEEGLTLGQNGKEEGPRVDGVWIQLAERSHWKIFENHSNLVITFSKTYKYIYDDRRVNPQAEASVGLLNIDLSTLFSETVYCQVNYISKYL